MTNMTDTSTSTITYKKVMDFILTLVVGTFVDCPIKYNSSDNNSIPHAGEHLKALPSTSVMGLVLGTLLCIGTVAVATMQILFIKFYITNPNRRTAMLYLATTAPFVSIISLIAAYMPRLWFLSHLIGILYFSLALWVIIWLLFEMFHGKKQLAQRLNEQKASITTSTPPFCCFFPFMPELHADGSKLHVLECMVKQCPLIRILMTIASLMIYFEYTTEGINELKMLDFLVLPSLLIGIYGTHILVTTVAKLDELQSYRYVMAFRMLDFFLAFFGIQHAVFDFLARVGVFSCGSGLLMALETAFFWKNLLVTFESFVVAVVSSVLLQPSRSAFFDKHPSCKGITCSNNGSSNSSEISPQDTTFDTIELKMEKRMPSPLPISNL